MKHRRVGFEDLGPVLGSRVQAFGARIREPDARAFAVRCMV